MTEPMKVRLRYNKLGKVRFLGHRDLARCWERALRRAELAVEYSQGFSPRPKMHFGLALSNGAESWAEYVEIDFAGPQDLESLPRLLTDCLPIGVECTAAALVAPGARSLQEQIDSCEWRFELSGIDLAEVERRVTDALAAEQLFLEVQRKGKGINVDLRPQIWSLAACSGEAATGTYFTTQNGEQVAREAAGVDAPVVLQAELATKPRGVRPDELLRALSLDGFNARISRLAQWTMTDDGRIEPISLHGDGRNRSSDASVQQSPEAVAR